MSLHILQVSDSHLGASDVFELSPGISPLRRTRALVEAIRDWIDRQQLAVDFIVHTGDLVHRGHLSGDDGASTALGLDLFLSLPKPVYWVIGNHDHRAAMHRCLGPLPSEPLAPGTDRWAYHFVRGGERVIVLDARGSLAHDPQGELSMDQLDCLGALLQTTREPATVFMHYPPIPLGCDWIDRTMTVRNGLVLHDLLRSHRDRIRGVFFGHVHRPSCAMRDGILYASCGSTSMHFPNWPTASSAIMSADPIAFAQLIQIDPQGVMVKPQWVAIDARGVDS